MALVSGRPLPSDIASVFESGVIDLCDDGTTPARATVPGRLQSAFQLGASAVGLVTGSPSQLGAAFQPGDRRTCSYIGVKGGRCLAWAVGGGLCPKHGGGAAGGAPAAAARDLWTDYDVEHVRRADGELNGIVVKYEIIDTKAIMDFLAHTAARRSIRTKDGHLVSEVLVTLLQQQRGGKLPVVTSETTLLGLRRRTYSGVARLGLDLPATVKVSLCKMQQWMGGCVVAGRKSL